MLKESDAFSGFSVDDIGKAQAFYGETLGIETEMTDAGLALAHPGPSTGFVYPKDNHEPATYTVLNFPVASVDAAVDQLSGRRADGALRPGHGAGREGHLARSAWTRDRLVQGSGGQHPLPPGGFTGLG